jgi:hypothetical protein
MSGEHIERLHIIQSELRATTAALAYISNNAHRTDIIGDPALSEFSIPFLNQVAKHLETTYFVRLSAEFEGILREHLATNHPDFVFPANKGAWKVDLFLTAVCRRDKFRCDPQLRRKLDEIRDQRNSLAHRSAGGAQITFTEALSRYNTFLAKLSASRS